MDDTLGRDKARSRRRSGWKQPESRPGGDSPAPDGPSTPGDSPTLGSDTSRDRRLHKGTVPTASTPSETPSPSDPAHAHIRPTGSTSTVTIKGEARAVVENFLSRPNGTVTSVVTFRLEQYDAARGRIGITPVRIVGDKALGFVSDGELIAKTAVNISTSAIYAATIRSRWSVAAMPAAALIIACIIAWVMLSPPGQGREHLEATTTLSTASGGVGTDIAVSGEGFKPTEQVTISFHTTQCASVVTDGRGIFSNVQCRVPANYEKFTGETFEVMTVGRSSGSRATNSFRLD
jgi:hypothetical protein